MDINELSQKFECYKIHISYIIGILILTIIMLTTLDWGGNEKLVDYITFALTLTSLTLSLLAIIQSLFSSSRFSETIGSLSSINEEVLITSKKLSEATIELDKKITNIPVSLKAVEKNTDETRIMVEKMSNVEKTKIPEKNKTTKNKPHSIIIETMVQTSSFVGQQVLYALSLSKKQNKTFSLKDVIGDDMIDYSFGYLIALASCGLIEYSETDRVIQAIKLNNDIDRIIKDMLYSAAKKGDKEYSNAPEFSWVKKAEYIEQYFNEKN